MTRPIVYLQGEIQDLHFRGQPANLVVYDWADFNINTVKPACRVRVAAGAEIALSKWTGPKRSRTYSHSGKIITVIPIIKDEGADTNCDRVNFITLSWMNLMNVYIILAWYSDAAKKSQNRLTQQKLENDYVCQKITEIVSYKMDAHHWNRQHFEQDFISIYDRALRSYELISEKLGVNLHSQALHRHFLEIVRNPTKPYCLHLEKYAQLSLPSSLRAATREVKTEHNLEQIQTGTAKGLLEIRNYLGGVYYLTADEIIFTGANSVVIQESKNTVKSSVPALNDIKDGLFKLLLYGQLQNLCLEGRNLLHSTCLRLTGRFSGRLTLPNNSQVIKKFIASAGLRSQSTAKLIWLNEELRLLHIAGIVEGTNA
ncbi:MAG: hypothetical protein ACK421_06155 [Pseudanabaenaceae cyanobacterium]